MAGRVIWKGAGRCAGDRSSWSSPTKWLARGTLGRELVTLWHHGGEAALVSWLIMPISFKT